MLRTTTRALLLAALATLALAGSAQAKQIQQYFYSGETLETGGSNAAAVALAGSDQTLLVVDSGDDAQGLRISKLDLQGVPVPFGPGQPTSIYTGEELNISSPIVAIAVDESSAGSSGNFYITSLEGGGSSLGSGKVYGYTSGGVALPGFPLSVPGACGLAVAPGGQLWIASALLGTYGEFTSSGEQTAQLLSLGARHGGCEIAIDSAGNFYLSVRERLAKYDPNLHFVGDLGPTQEETPVRSIGFDRGDDTLFELFGFGANPLTQVDSSGDPITTFGGPDPAHFGYEGLGSGARHLAVNSQTHDVYVLKESKVNVFSRDASVVTVPTVTISTADGLAGAAVTLNGSLDPDGVDTTDCRFEWGISPAYGKTVPCTQGNVFSGGSGETAVSASIAGLERGTAYHFRLSSKNANGVVGFSRDKEFTFAESPIVSEASASHITATAARINFKVNTNGGDTDFHIEIGADTNYGASFPVPDARVASTRPRSNFELIEVILTPQSKTQEVKGLEPGTEYHYRVVAENVAGRTESDDRIFTTFALGGSGTDSCTNAQARQQTGAADLAACRAYELVSAPETGGYDVRSNLSPGVNVLPTSPRASGRALYSMRAGTIPGIAGNPTNRGADPYLATRDSTGWSTRYVGLSSSNPFATGPFASPLSGFDAALGSFAFGGDEICDPCFADGSTNVPLRLPDGSVVQGMAGSMSPAAADPAGTVVEPLSDDGSHFVFGTTAQFEPAANSDGNDATIYSRDLDAGSTEVVSTDAAGATIANGNGVAELAVSSDGSRAVVGELISTDPAGNDYHHLYLHIEGSKSSVDLTPGTTTGAIFNGMTSDGSKLFFTTTDTLTGEDTDTSADIYADDVSGLGSVTSKLLSSGAGGTGDTDACSAPGDPNNWNAVSGDGKCNALAFAGGAGVASQSGDFYFLSPELLDAPSNGTQDQANLYLVKAGTPTPHFVATIDSSLVKSPPAPPTRPVETTEFGGSHANPQALAVDQSSGDVYVTEGSSTLSRYTAAGAPHSFTEVPGEGNKIGGLSFVESAPEVAVDNSGGLFDGDIYVTNYPNVSIFSPSGKSLGQLSGFGEVCGVAVDQSNGDVYVGDYNSRVWRYSPTDGTLPISNANYAVSGITASIEPCAVAADNGNVYAATWANGPVRQFSAASFEAGFPNVSGDLVDSSANALSVDPVTHELYVDEGNQIVTFNPAREKQLTIGAGELSGSRGVAVNATSHHVYRAKTFAASITEFGYEFTPYEPINNPAIVHAVKQAGSYDSADFEVTPDGEYAAFASAMPIDGYDSAGHYEVFRYDTGEDASVCVSCAITRAEPVSDATLTPYGSSLTDDGRVLFTTGEQLALRDLNEKNDAYEWSEGQQNLISTGTSESDSSLLSVSADGRDAFFFTRQKLVPEDHNGSSIRLYTAREGGGFAFGPPAFQCAASDECHGPGTEPARPLSASTTAGAPGQYQAETKVKCRKGTVKRRGRCVKRHPHKRSQHKRVKAERGGGK